MINLKNALLSLFFPRRCPFCGKIIHHDGFVCNDCLLLLPLADKAIHIPHAFGGAPGFLHCAAPFYYEGIVRKGIINFKFFAKTNLTAVFSGFAADTVKSQYAGIKFDFVTCVPLTFSERKKRGFNQSEIFGKALAARLSLPFKNVLSKPSEIKPQRTLSYYERWKNVSGAFKSRKIPDGAAILLVDDVVTTGATLSECAAALKSSGAGKVYCAAIAHTKYGR